MDVFAGEPVLSVRALTQRYQGRTVLDGINLTVHRGNRLGLLGVNGCGKSTLLRLIAGSETPDGGEIVRSRQQVTGYLPQEFDLEPGRSVRESVEDGLADLRELLAAYQASGERLAHDPGAMAEHEALHAEIDHRNGWNLDTEITRLMTHLRVPDGELEVGRLSGGEQRRVALCRTLVAHPDLLLLDEPTNHLDAATIEWLEGYLANYTGTVLLITHDRYFLDRVADRMVELEGGRLAEYVGNYSDYLGLKAERMIAEARGEHVRQMTLKRELAWVRKQPQGRAAKQQARTDRYNELADATPPEPRGDADLAIPFGPRLGNRVVTLKGVGKRYGDRQVLDGLDLELKAGERLGVIGPNGVGKTTLMRLLMGELEPDTGTVEIGTNTRFVYADQGRARLDPEKTVLEEVAGESQWVTVGDRTLSVRSYLKRFLFSEEQAATLVRRLSGGEQNRVQLAKLLRVGGNVLILDEPTNDLDLLTLRVLEEAIADFPGSALVVSHDRYFLNRVATAILAFEDDGRISYSLGSYDAYLERRLAAATAAASRPATPTSAAARPVREAPRKLSYKESKELETIDSDIEAAEAAHAALELRLQDPALYAERGQDVSALLAETEAAKGRVEALYERWQALEALRDGE